MLANKIVQFRKFVFLSFYISLFVVSFLGSSLFLKTLQPLQHFVIIDSPKQTSFFVRKHVGEFLTTSEIAKAKPTVAYQAKPGDEPLSNCTYERPKPRRKIAVFAASTPDFVDFSDLTSRWQNSYAFYLPITVLAWKRIGFESCAVITGNKQPWFDQNSPLNLVRNIVKAYGGDLIFLETSNELKSGLSQLARLFVADMEPYKNQPDTYLLTSDIDILPISSTIYDMPSTADIHITDAWCCYVIAHKGRAYRMFPMATIGMRVSTWQTMMDYSSYSKKENVVDRIWDAVIEEFGSVPYNMSRGVNGRWFFDQRLVSYRIGQWRTAAPSQRNCRLSLRRARLSGNEFRWIRDSWPPPGSTKERLLSANDAHGPPDPPITKEGYEQLLGLATVLTEEFNFNFTDYWLTFTNMMTRNRN